VSPRSGPREAPQHARDAHPGLSPNAQVVVTGAMFALFLAALEQTIVSTALPAIMADLGHVELSSWVITSYLIATVCATPVLGKLSDMLGRTAVLRVCLGLFVAASVLCALSPTMYALIAGRALQGIGGGGLIVMAQTIVGDAVPPRERGRFASYFSIVWMSAAVLGPVIGGVLTQHTGWRWVFWINLPLGVAATILSERGLRVLPQVRRPARMDLVGIALLTIAAITLLVVASRARTLLAWDASSIVLATISIIAWMLFLRRQRVVHEPIVPSEFLRDPVIGPVLTTSFLAFGAYLALTVITPLYFQIGLRLSAADSGLLLVPMMATSSVSAFLAGRYTKTHGRYRMPPLVTLPFAIAGCIALALVMPQGSALAVTLLTAFIALAIGPMFPCCMVAAQYAAGPRHLGAVSGAVALSRSLGAAVVTGLLMAVLLSTIIRLLPELAPLSSLEDLLRRPLDPNARTSIMRAFAPLTWVVAGVLALGWLAFARVEDRELKHAPRTS